MRFNSFSLVPICLLALILTQSSFKQTPTTLGDVCLTTEEAKLYELIMSYRKEKKLPLIPISKSLTYVAQTHVKDLQNNQPVKGKCNMHSWSKKGNWSNCCYTPDHSKSACMWNKPRELTSYAGDGFEIAHWNSLKSTPEDALEGWKKSKGHNEVIINKGIWKTANWNAIGIGIHKNYACVWFGKEADTEGKINECK